MSTLEWNKFIVISQGAAQECSPHTARLEAAPFQDESLIAFFRSVLGFHQKRIALAFFGNRRQRTVTRDDNCFLWQRQDGVVQGAHDLLHRAAWKISTADGTGE